MFMCFVGILNIQCQLWCIALLFKIASQRDPAQPQAGNQTCTL